MDIQAVGTMVLIAGTFFTAVVFVIRLALAPFKQSIDNLTAKIIGLEKRYDSEHDIRKTLSMIVNRHEKEIDNHDKRITEAHELLRDHDSRIEQLERERGR